MTDTAAAPALSAETMSRLAFVRYEFALAVAQAKPPEPANVVAVNLFHDCADLFLQRRVEWLSLGADPARMRRFQMLGPHVQIAMAGNPRIAYRASRESPTEDDARFCYQFVIEIALTLQRRELAFE